MSIQTICNGCGEVIDRTKNYVTLTGQTVKMNEQNVLIVLGNTSQLDYHIEHTPSAGDHAPPDATPVVEPTTPPDDSGGTGS